MCGVLQSPPLLNKFTYRNLTYIKCKTSVDTFPSSHLCLPKLLLLPNGSSLTLSHTESPSNIALIHFYPKSELVTLHMISFHDLRVIHTLTHEADCTCTS